MLTPFDSQDDQSLRSLLRTVLLSVPDAMIVIDETGIIAAFSAAAEKLFGYSADDVRGKNVSLLMTQTDRPHHDQYIANYIETGEKQIIGIGRVVQAKLANGEEIPVELTIGETRLGHHRLFTGYIRDVTDRQAAEQRINQMQSELANFSRLSAVGTMASTMAHELNQPLTAVSNYLEGAQGLLDNPTEETLALIKEALSAATKQSVRAGQIVKRLRDYVSNGKIETVPVNVETVIAEAVSLSKLGMEGPLPRVIAKVENELPLAQADRIQIRQVLVNLLKNAIEATAGMQAPQIRVFAKHNGNGFVQIDVSDDGPGIAQHEEHTPFDPFYSSKRDGMGLGLSICKTIIDLHGGIISTQPNEPSGATFSFTLKTIEMK
jgi:two-component system sensor kinase FixL